MTEIQAQKNKDVVDTMIDEFLVETFPASDAPNWNSLQHLLRELAKDQTAAEEDAP